MAAFTVFGKYIAEPGGPDILNECHIIEKGSLKSCISGKRYKRSKRAHHLLALTRESNETTEISGIIEGEIFNLETNDSCDLNL